MENKVKVWLARDADGKLYAHSKRPNKMENYWGCEVYTQIFRLDSSLFSSVKWKDDEPTEAYITLAEPQEKSQPKIDWEQRRYEIAKEMMPVLYRQGMEAQKHGQSVKRKDTAYYAVIFADMLIEKLKKSE